MNVFQLQLKLDFSFLETFDFPLYYFLSIVTVQMAKYAPLMNMHGEVVVSIGVKTAPLVAEKNLKRYFESKGFEKIILLLTNSAVFAQLVLFAIK